MRQIIETTIGVIGALCLGGIIESTGIKWNSWKFWAIWVCLAAIEIGMSAWN